MGSPALALHLDLPGSREFDAAFSFPRRPTSFRRARLQFQIGKTLGLERCHLSAPNVLPGRARGSQDSRQHHRLFSSPCGALPIVLCGRDLQGSEHTKPGWQDVLARIRALRCCDPETKPGRQIRALGRTQRRPTGVKHGTRAGRVFRICARK
jgi:hypothetical protein